MLREFVCFHIPNKPLLCTKGMFFFYKEKSQKTDLESFRSGSDGEGRIHIDLDGFLSFLFSTILLLYEVHFLSALFT